MICPRCGEPSRRGGRYCLSCHAAYQRVWRMGHPSTDEQRQRDNARSYAGVYKRRGKLTPQPCACGSEAVEMHHPDYSRPLDVRWLCRPCHLKLHQGAAP